MLSKTSPNTACQNFKAVLLFLEENMEEVPSISMNEFKMVVEDFRSDMKKMSEAILARQDRTDQKLEILQEEVGSLKEGQTILRIGQERFEKKFDGLETRVNGIELKVGKIETKIDGIEKKMDEGFQVIKHELKNEV
jgi:hypothetical protein